MASAPKWVGASDLVATPRSGTLTCGERVTYVMESSGRKADCDTYAQLHARGTIWSVAGMTGSFIVEESQSTGDRGGVGVVRTNLLWLNLALPEEYSVTPSEINPPVENSPIFAALTARDIELAKSTLTAQADGMRESIMAAIADSSNPSLTALLIDKLQRGVQSYYLDGLRYQWTQTLYTLSGVTLRRGGYRETPSGPGVLPSGTTWLRQADEHSESNGLYKLTRSWLGGPSGHWDTDLYNTTPV